MYQFVVDQDRFKFLTVVIDLTNLEPGPAMLELLDTCANLEAELLIPRIREINELRVLVAGEPLGTDVFEKVAANEALRGEQVRDLSDLLARPDEEYPGEYEGAKKALHKELLFWMTLSSDAFFPDEKAEQDLIHAWALERAKEALARFSIKH